MAHKWMICLLAGFAHMAFVSCAAACPDGAVTAGDWGWTDINFTGRTGYEKNWRLLSLSASRCA